MRRKKALLRSKFRLEIIGAAVLIAVASGVSVAAIAFWPHRPAPIKLAARPILAVGQIMQAGDFSVRVDSVREDAVGDRSFFPGPDMRFVVTRLSFRNNGAAAIYLAPVAQAYIRDSQGAVYQMSPATTSNPLIAGNVLPGLSLSGEISFNVPSSATGLNLYYQIANYQPAVISLGR